MAEETGTMLPSMRLDGRTALVTGAGRGIGRGCALGLAELGAEVVLLARTGAEIEEAAEEIRSAGGAARASICDVTDIPAVRALIAGLPRLDVFVNNAGINRPQPFVEVSEENLDLMIDINFRAAFLGAQAAARKMLENDGGSIVGISSQMGHVGGPERSVYCATKFAMEGMTKAMAIELATQGVRVNTVAPTFIETLLVRQVLNTPERQRWVKETIPMGRIGQVSEVVSAVCFLASPAASLITGTSILVDGGWTAR